MRNIKILIIISLMSVNITFSSEIEISIYKINQAKTTEERVAAMNNFKEVLLNLNIEERQLAIKEMVQNKFKKDKINTINVNATINKDKIVEHINSNYNKENIETSMDSDFNKENMEINMNNNRLKQRIDEVTNQLEHINNKLEIEEIHIDFDRNDRNEGNNKNDRD